MPGSVTSTVRHLLPTGSTTTEYPYPERNMLRESFDILTQNWVLTLAYTIDWVVTIVIAAAGAGLNFVPPSHRLFSVLDLTISYPIKSEVSIATVVIVAGAAPAIIVLLVVLLFVPGQRWSRGLKRAETYRVKAWELERGWAGLALALATAFFITQGTKQLFGKPRPNMLARCQPDINNIASHIVSGYGEGFSRGWTLVDISICTTTDRKSLDDGFRSFPSGHSSFSWAGLLYLTLFLCAKFQIAFPHLPVWSKSFDRARYTCRRTNDFELQQSSGSQSDGEAQMRQHRILANTEASPARNLAATPPHYLLILAAIPIAVAVYISSTRYTDYYHFGFDIIAGSLLGILTAWFSFRWTHLPVERGHGWAWGARSKNRAFGIGLGTEGYVEHESVTDMGFSRAGGVEARMSYGLDV